MKPEAMESSEKHQPKKLPMTLEKKQAWKLLGHVGVSGYFGILATQEAWCGS